MRFEVLGPLAVVLGERRFHLRSHRQRVILTMLLMSARQVVAIDTLIDAMWPGGAPATARNQVHVCVSALRRLLGSDVLSTTGAGYRLDVTDEQVDLLRFEAWCARANALAQRGSPAEAAAVMRRATGLWRGPMLSDVDCVAVTGTIVRLTEQLAAAQDSCVEWELAAGRDGELVAELTERVAQHPLRTQARKQLMIALCRTGRSADALAVYREGRQAFVEELGLEPSEELRRLEARILAGTEIEPTATVTPRQLPRDFAEFTGRDSLIDDAREALDAGTLVTLSGAPGSGKSALAVHIGHRLGTDGQLYADLRGSTADPAEPAEVLGGFLRALGAHNLPAPLGDRAALFRSLVADRALLVVLDDAASEGHVTPLLPGSSTCRVIVTSRVRLAGLPGAREVDVGPLDAHEAVRMLGAIAGPDRVAAEPATARRLVELVDGLPLGLRIIGSRLLARPHWSLRSMVTRLADPRTRLDELTYGDLSMRQGIQDAYDQLPRAERLLLRRLCRAGGEVTEDAELLTDLHLVRDNRISDLVRIFVDELTPILTPVPSAA